MKKLLLTVCCFILIGFQSKAQLDTIPNSGFENWYYTPFWTIEAAGWQTNNASIAAWNVAPDSNSYSGLLALKIEKVSYRGTIWSGFPVSHHPLTLEGFAKNGLNISDTAIIIIQVYSNNTVVDSGYSEIYGGIGTNYLPFSINITQSAPSADSCVIMIIGGNIFNSTIWFDDLSFTFPTSANENFSNDGWMVFPNPVKNEFTIYGLRSTISKIEIYDVTGKIRQTSDIGRQTISVADFPPGIYLLSITSGKKMSHHLVIKN